VAKKMSARAAAKQAKDKWKAKSWYRVLAPPSFNQVYIGDTIASEEGLLIDRVQSATMFDITNEIQKMHVKLRFRIYRVHGSDAHTYFLGHELSSDYIRRFTRRRNSKMDDVIPVTTSDGFGLVVKPVAITDNRINSSQKRAIRKIMEEIITETATKTTYPEFVQEMVQGRISAQVHRMCKTIYPIRRVEVRKSHLELIPEGFDFSTFRMEERPEPVPDPEMPRDQIGASPSPSPPAGAMAPAPKDDAGAIFVEDLCRLKGIGASKAQLLYEAGYLTVVDVANAKLDELSEVTSISRSLAERLIEDAVTHEPDRDVEAMKADHSVGTTKKEESAPEEEADDGDAEASATEEEEGASEAEAEEDINGE